MMLFDLLTHRYIRSGETVQLFADDGSYLGDAQVSVNGFGPYATVYTTRGHTADRGTAIRRDGIMRDIQTGKWRYRFQGE
jgi:hypothetical protein